MVIGVDVDGVVADLKPAWLAIYNMRFEDDLKKEDILEFSWAKYVKPEAETAYLDILDEEFLYVSVEPIPAALTAIQTMRRMGDRVVFITTCRGSQHEQKHNWLINHGFLPVTPGGWFHPDYVAMSDKTLAAVDLLIDDRLETIKDMRKARKRAILFWSNRHPEGERWPGILKELYQP